MSKVEGLLNQADRLRREADLLLKKSKLLSLLVNYGHVSITGSYRLNLMTKGDIDIHVVNSKTSKSQVRKALDQLIDQNFFDGYHFHDWVSHFRTARVVFGNDPLKGYYIALKTVFMGRRWKIDLWFLKQQDKKGGRVMKMFDNLTDETRLTILKLKTTRDEKKLDISSARIYKAVLTKHVKTTTALPRLAKPLRAR